MGGLLAVLAIGCRADDVGLGPAGPGVEPDPGSAVPEVTPPTSVPAPSPPPSAACVAGQVHCVGRTPQYCGADGKWVLGEACSYVCQDGCVNRFAAISSGRGSPTDNDGLAEFVVNNELIFSKPGGLFGARGFNVAVIDPASGQRREQVRNFDPWISPLTGRALNELADYLDALEPGQVVMIAVSDDAGITDVDGCGPRDVAPVQRVVATLRRMGSTLIDSYCFRGAWSFVAISGQPGEVAEKLTNGTKITTEVLLPATP